VPGAARGPPFRATNATICSCLCDKLLGELLDQLDQTGLASRSILIVTADHGACFRPTSATAKPRLATSWISQPCRSSFEAPVKLRNRGRRRDPNGRHSAHLAHLLGTSLPWPVDGEEAERSELSILDVQHAKNVSFQWDGRPWSAA